MKARGCVTDAQRNVRHILSLLKGARVVCDLTQGQAAKEIGKSQNWLSDVEKQTTELGLNDLCALADIYGLEIRLCPKDF